MFDTPEATPVRTRRLARSERADTGSPRAEVLPASEIVPVAVTSLRRDRTRSAADAAPSPVAVPFTSRAARRAVIVEAVRAAESSRAAETAGVAEVFSVDAPTEVPDAPAAVAVSDAGDAFAEARLLFSTAEVPVIASDLAVAAEPPVRHRVPQRRRGVVRRLATAGSTALVMAVTSLIAVSMTLPSGAVAAAQGAHAFSTVSLALVETEAAVIDPEQIQAFVTPEDVEIEVLDRTATDLTTVSLVDLAAEQGINYSSSLYTNDPNAAIQWPFLVGVAMSSPYGPRRGTMHQGIDLVPGSGAPVQAIADGVVRVSSESGGGYGVHVWIDHVIDGVAVSSHYGHMQHGSLQVEAGEEVSVGDIIGKTGNTGRSNGAHLHFEITINGTIVNPLPWMRENAGRYEY